MKVGEAIAEIMKREGIEILCGYPVNHLIEFAAAIDIRPVMVRQERIGLHMADAISRMTSGRKIGAFCMQHGPGAENAFGGVAQAFGESVPILVLPMGYPRRIAHDPAELLVGHQHAQRCRNPPSRSSLAAEVPNIMRRAFTRLRNGRGGPVIVEIPGRHLERGSARAARLHAGSGDALRPRPRPCARGRGSAGQGEATGDLCRPGRPLRAGVAAARGARGAARGACGDQPRRQEFVPGDAPAVARLGRRGDAAPGAAFPQGRRRHPRHRLQLHARRTSQWRCRRARRSSTRRSIPII